MKKLTIVEFEKNHYRAVITLLKVVEEFYRDKYEVHLFINDEVFDNIKRELSKLSIPVKISIFSQRRNVLYYFRKVLFFVKLALHKSDITYINTLEPIAKFVFFLRPRGRKIYNFHHIEYLTAEKKILRDKIMFQIVRNEKEFSTLTAYQKEKLQRIFPNSQISIVPDGYYRGVRISASAEQIQEGKKKVTFTIPGVISVLRKDYKTVFEVFENIDKTKYLLHLLGTFSKNEMYYETRKLVEEYIPKINLIFYDRYLTDEEMERGIIDSDVIIAPSTSGEYGSTKVTGAFFYVVEYGKPGIFPNTYHFTNIKETIIYYSSKEELEEIVNRILDDKQYLLELQERSQKEIESKFSLRNVKEGVLFL